MAFFGFWNRFWRLASNSRLRALTDILNTTQYAYKPSLRLFFSYVWLLAYVHMGLGPIYENRKNGLRKDRDNRKKKGGGGLGDLGFGTDFCQKWSSEIGPKDPYSYSETHTCGYSMERGAHNRCSGPHNIPVSYVSLETENNLRRHVFGQNPCLARPIPLFFSVISILSEPIFAIFRDWPQTHMYGCQNPYI